MKWCLGIILPLWKPSTAFNLSLLNCSFNTYSFPKSLLKREGCPESHGKYINLRTRYTVMPITASMQCCPTGVWALHGKNIILFRKHFPVIGIYKQYKPATMPGDVQMGVCLNLGIQDSTVFRQAKDSLKWSKILFWWTSLVPSL